jgi:hypothetical protein
LSRHLWLGGRKRRLWRLFSAYSQAFGHILISTLESHSSRFIHRCTMKWKMFSEFSVVVALLVTLFARGSGSTRLPASPPSLANDISFPRNLSSQSTPNVGLDSLGLRIRQSGCTAEYPVLCDETATTFRCCQPDTQCVSPLTFRRCLDSTISLLTSTSVFHRLLPDQLSLLSKRLLPQRRRDMRQGILR